MSKIYNRSETKHTWNEKRYRIFHFFSDEIDSNNNSQDSSDSLVRNKDKPNPPRNKKQVLDRVINLLHKQNFEETNQIIKSNISKHKRKVLMELKKPGNIIIMEADL